MHGVFGKGVLVLGWLPEEPQEGSCYLLLARLCLLAIASYGQFVERGWVNEEVCSWKIENVTPQGK